MLLLAALATTAKETGIMVVGVCAVYDVIAADGLRAFSSYLKRENIAPVFDKPVRWYA